MLSKEELKTLRSEIVLNSIFLKDYSNSFGIRKKKVCDFFDGYIDYLYELQEEEKNGFSLAYPDDVIDKYDNIDNLYAWLLCFEEDPLSTMDDEIEELIKEYSKSNDITIYTDYRDFDNIEYSLYNLKKDKNGNRYKEKVTDKYEYICEIEDSYIDYIGDLEIDYIDDFKNTIKDEELLNYIDSDNGYSNLLDMVRSYVNINYPIEDFLRQEIKINIFWSIKNKSGWDDVFYPFLMHSQGYKCKDYTYLKKMLKNLHTCYGLYKKFTKKELKQMKEDRKNNKFINSLIREIENAYLDSPRELCVIARITIEDYFKLLEKNKKFTINKDCEIGLVDPYNGGGSLLEIELEKDIVMNTNDIEIKVEGVDRYTVDDIYGLVSSCYKDCVVF